MDRSQKGPGIKVIETSFKYSAGDTNVHLGTDQREVGEQGEKIYGTAYGDEKHADGTPRNIRQYQAYRPKVNDKWGKWKVSFGTDRGPIDEEFQEALRQRLKEKFPDSSPEIQPPALRFGGGVLPIAFQKSSIFFLSKAILSNASSTSAASRRVLSSSSI